MVRELKRIILQQNLVTMSCRLAGMNIRPSFFWRVFIEPKSFRMDRRGSKSRRILV